MNLADLIDRNAAFTPNKPALHCQGETWTYAQFAHRIASLADALSAQFGVARGDRVAILSQNHPDYLALLYACARLGAMLVPLNWRLATPELLFILADADVRLLIVAGEFEAAVTDASTRAVMLDALRDLPPLRHVDPVTDWSTPVLIVYTAGTTGRPKGAVLTQQALLANAVMSQHMHAMTSDDHVLTVLPLFHVGGLNIQTTPALQLGATVTLHARFTPDDTLRAIAMDKPTLTVLVPSTIQPLLDHPQWQQTDLSSLRAISTGSTLVPQGLVDAVQARGVSMLQVYGSTETSPIAVYTRLGGDLSRPLSTGLPGLLCEARIVDHSGLEVPANTPGEVEVRGPNVLTEYWRNPTATAEALHDGWFRTGDIALRDTDGYFTIHDRKKNMIVSGGENIYPAEVERVLLDHPQIAEAAVIGVADPRWQEVPIAFVVTRTTISGDEVRAHLLSQLARFKVPREIVFVQELPRNALGKVQHFRLRESWGPS
ncbi:MAG TPA: AMP-binding protein [Acetobacteraceae bacterium]|nr:AMP-binding protein [Acetobacteraceae bacterium]